MWIKASNGRQAYVLTLTREEAEMLTAITGKFIHGGPTQPIYQALCAAGVEGFKGEVWSVPRGPGGKEKRLSETLIYKKYDTDRDW